jgi:hypothetical protein
MRVNWLMRSALSCLIAYVGLFGVAQAQDIAITNATLYTSPGAVAQPHTTVLIQGGKIVAVTRIQMMKSALKMQRIQRQRCQRAVKRSNPLMPRLRRLRRILEYARPLHWSAVERGLKDPRKHADTADAGHAHALRIRYGCEHLLRPKQYG